MADPTGNSNLLTGYGSGAGSAPTAVIPAQNPYLQGILDRQTQQAKSYRSNIPQMADQQYGQYEAQSRRNLADSMKKVDTDYNRRGLLYSGKRTGAQYGTIASANNDLASARQNINSQLMGNADQLDANAVNTAGSMAGLGFNLGNGLISAGQAQNNADSANQAANQYIFNQAGGAFGNLAANIYKNSGSFGNTPSGASTGAAAGGYIGTGNY